MAIAIAFGSLACGDDDGGGNTPDASTMSDASTMMDGSTDSGSGGTGGTGGTGGSAGSTMPPPLMCGGATCTIPAQAMMLGTTPCCTEDDTCGGMSMLGPSCIPLGQVGSYDESCPDVMPIASFPITFQGCCTEDGQCGSRDPTAGGFGCIPPDQLTATAADAGASQACTYNADEMCTSILVAECDGTEDCPSGQQCCGRFSGQSYSSFTCEDSCVELAQEGGIVSQICHPGDECDEPLPSDAGMMMMPTGPYECRVNTMYLPGFWYRCRDTGTEPTEAGSVASGEINCGESVCGSGQKCCYSRNAGDAINDGTAHCVDADADCTCVPGSGGDPDGGGEDGGS